MKFNYYGHSCFTMETSGGKLLFDPFLTGNPKLGSMIMNMEPIQADYIFVSHGHGDHTDDLVRIATETKAKVISVYEIHEWLQKHGIENTHPMNIGGQWDFGDIRVKCVQAVHSSVLPDGTYAGNPMGFLIWVDGKSIYYAGDTALTMDMQLIPSWAKLDVAVLPIGDNFTMGYEDALRCAEMVECKHIIGVHFDTFGYIEVNHKVAEDTFAQKGVTLKLPEIGESFNL